MVCDQIVVPCLGAADDSQVHLEVIGLVIGMGWKRSVISPTNRSVEETLGGG